MQQANQKEFLGVTGLQQMNKFIISEWAPKERQIEEPKKKKKGQIQMNFDETEKDDSLKVSRQEERDETSSAHIEMLEQQEQKKMHKIEQDLLKNEIEMMLHDSQGVCEPSPSLNERKGKVKKKEGSESESSQNKSKKAK